MVWTPHLELTAEETLPVYVRLAQAVVEGVRTGRLRPGERLPGTRRLAAQLSLNRSTVLAAFAELEAEGWVESRGTAGTFIAVPLPAPIATPPAPPETVEVVPVGYVLPPLRGMAPPVEPDRGVLNMAGGSPDLRLVPVEEIARAWRAGLRRFPAALLDYGDAQGHPRLRAALAAMLSATRGLAIGGEQVLVTRGSQMALYLAAQTLLRPGDRVGIEALGYPPAREALRQAGADLVPLPVDAEGLQIEALAAADRQSPLRAVYLTPHHQFPTMVTLSPARRLALMALARTRGMLVLEDDYDHEFHYSGRPVLPLASADPSGQVVYLGTLSKVLAPGLRLGFVVAPPPVLERLVRTRLAVDRQGDIAVEAAVATLIEDGTLRRHMWRSRRIYQERRGVLLALLQAHLGTALAVTPPAGGLALWARVHEDLDADAWAAAAQAAGVCVSPGSAYRHDGQPSPHLRIGFGRLDAAELGEGIRRLCAARPPLRQRLPAGASSGIGLR